MATSKLADDTSSTAESEASARVGATAEDPAANLRALIAAGRWEQSAEQLITDIVSVTNACTARQLPIIEIKQLGLAFCIGIQTLVELRDGTQNAVLGRLVAAMQSFDHALRERGAGSSAQGRYAEARVSSRRALSENHDPVLDHLPELVALSVEVCSHDVAEYMGRDVGLPYDAFLDMLHMLAHDGADPATVANPPARIRRALSRADQRRNRRDRKRWTPPTPAQTEGLEDPQDVESTAIAELDWERGRRDLQLPPDQTRAVEARLDGLNLQASKAPEELGWDAAHLERVRRSLGPDRRWGQKLRKRFRAYAPKRNPAEQS